MKIATAMRLLRRLSVVASVLFMAGAYSPPLLAATIVVNSTLDAPDANRFDGVCETAPGNGVCTLRAATQEVSFGAGTIVLPAGTYQLSAPGGTLIVPGGITILGAGEDVTIIDGGALDTVINNSSGETRLVGLTIQNGKKKGGLPTGFFSGGGIVNLSLLKLQNVTVRDNVADIGAGIYNGGTLTIDESTISGNTADSLFGRGGGISNSGTLTIRNSTLSGNAAVNIDSGSGVDFGTGGGIYNDGAFDLTNVTISGNGGGAIYSASTGTSYMASVTIAFHSNGPALTIAKVQGANGADMSGTHNINHALLSNNTPNCSQGVAPGRIVSQGYNLDSDNTCGLAADGTSIIGQVPLLSPLAFYGGPTKTHDLAGAGVDAGDPAGCFDHLGPILRDQRGGNRTVRGRCDIGAVEQAAGVAAAGRDQRVNPGQTVTLDGRNSFGDALISFYAWTQTAGTPVALSDANKAVATFTAPPVPGSMNFRLSLKVGQAPDESSDSVTVTVNAPPVANAGGDQTNLVYPVPVSNSIALDGRQSTDPDGVIASFAWVQTGGTSVVLNDAGRGRVTFLAPQVVGTLTFQLTVTDNEGLSSTDSVTVTMNPYPPIPASGGGGGCTLGRDSPSDPLLPALVALATLVLWRRKKRA